MSRRKRRVIGGVVVCLALAVGISGGAALALWVGQSSTSPLVAQQAVLGFAVTKDAIEDAATSASATVGFTVGQAEATALVDAGPDQDGDFAVAVPFDVTMLTSAGLGIDYTIAIDVAQPDTVFGLPGVGPQFFPVDDPANCTVGLAGSQTPYVPPDPVNGIAAGTNAPTTRVDHWCLVITVTPPTYATSSYANGTNLLSDPEVSVPGTDSAWLAYLIPDPAAEPSLAVTITPVLVPPANAG